MADAAENSIPFDSGRQYLGKVYAKALLGATEKTGKTDAVLAELDSLVHDVLAKLPKLSALLDSPRVPSEEKVKILDRAFAHQMSKELLNFLKVASKHGRLDCLAAINAAAKDLYNELRGRVEVQVRTAEPVGPEQLDKIANQLRLALKRDVELRVAVDPALLGGLVVRIGDTVYDGSVANRLRRLRDETLDKTAIQIRQALDRFATGDV